MFGVFEFLLISAISLNPQLEMHHTHIIITDYYEEVFKINCLWSTQIETFYVNPTKLLLKQGLIEGNRVFLTFSRDFLEKKIRRP